MSRQIHDRSVFEAKYPVSWDVTIQGAHEYLQESENWVKAETTCEYFARVQGLGGNNYKAVVSFADADEAFAVKMRWG